MDVDPYKLFGFQKGQPFTIDELKAKFKQLAMVSHPDKGGSEELFLLVAKCFKLLMKEYERRTAQAQHHELKRAFEASTANSSAPEDAIPDASGKGFNLKKFLDFIESNKLPPATVYCRKDLRIEEGIFGEADMIRAGCG